MQSFTSLDTPGCRLCISSSQNSEYMLAPSTLGQIMKSSKKSSHCDCEYVCSSSRTLSAFRSSTLLFSSTNFKSLFFGVAILLLNTIVVFFSGLFLAIQLSVISCSVTIQQTDGLFTAEPCHTANICLLSRIPQQRDTRTETHFHSTISRVFTTNPYRSHFCSGPTTTSQLLEGSLTVFLSALNPRVLCTPLSSGTVVEVVRM